jgi:uncharacterized protein (DUF58 family)
MNKNRKKNRPAWIWTLIFIGATVAVYATGDLLSSILATILFGGIVFLIWVFKGFKIY